MRNPPPQTPPPKGGGACASPSRKRIATKTIKYARHSATKNDIRRARNLRHDMPKAERLLWKKLRELPPDLGLTFRRQHPMHPYILDFACIKIRLAIELDGASHDNRQSHDRFRDNYLLGKGYTTLRFTNDELLKNADGVVETIISQASRLARTEALPPWGEGWVGGRHKR